MDQVLARAVELTNVRVLRISGADRLEFLQGQLTQDIGTLTNLNSPLAGWASAKGRLLAIGQLVDWQDSIYLLLPADIAEPVARRLSLFVLRNQVNIDLTDFSVLGLSGEGTETLTIQNLDLPAELFASRSNDNLCTMRVAGDPGRAWVIGTAEVIQSITTTLSADTESQDAWVLQNIRSGIPVVLPETSEMFVPQMLNLDLLGGISFTKGCYVGQEIVARTHNLGRIKRRMFRFRCDTDRPLPPSALVYGPESTTGRVVIATSEQTGTELLAVIPIAESDQPWYADEDRSTALERLPLPYPIPEVTN